MTLVGVPLALGGLSTGFLRPTPRGPSGRASTFVWDPPSGSSVLFGATLVACRVTVTVAGSVLSAATAFASTATLGTASGRADAARRLGDRFPRSVLRVVMALATGVASIRSATILELAAVVHTPGSTLAGLRGLATAVHLAFRFHPSVPVTAATFHSRRLASSIGVSGPAARPAASFPELAWHRRPPHALLHRLLHLGHDGLDALQVILHQRLRDLDALTTRRVLHLQQTEEHLGRVSLELEALFEGVPGLIDRRPLHALGRWYLFVSHVYLVAAGDVRRWAGDRLAVKRERWLQSPSGVQPKVGGEFVAYFCANRSRACAVRPGPSVEPDRAERAVRAGFFR